MRSRPGSGLRDLGQQPINVSAKGPAAVAQLAAEIMIASDAAYFCADLRRSKLIPIFVENPTDFERTEGKGHDPLIRHPAHTRYPEAARQGNLRLPAPARRFGLCTG